MDLGSFANAFKLWCGHFETYNIEVRVRAPCNYNSIKETDENCKTDDKELRVAFSDVLKWFYSRVDHLA